MCKIKKVSVIGAGFMGRSIALLCAQNGIKAINIDVSIEQLDKAKTQAEKILTRLLEKGKTTLPENKDILMRLSYSTKMADIQYSDVVIEAVPENMELKKEIIRQIEKHINPNSIILSNTSGLSITEIARDASIPERIMCVHFFNPPTVMKLVEMIRGEKTDEKTFERTSSFVEQLGRQPVNAPELPGFIVNRLLIPMINDAAFLLMDGANKEDIDTAMKLGANHKMGPLELGDFIGLDIVLAIMETLHAGLKSDKYLPCPLIVQMVAEKKLGIKTKQGFYDY